MAERNFTPEQESAINTTDKTLLVSAAAGSGKTATLTERIIRSLIRDTNPEEINRMLIVTFTNAAVGELKERIRAALESALKNNPENKSLERQLTLLPMAKISTIDSFCNEILRKNSDKVGIPPNYRIADAAEAQILSYSILAGLIDALYENERVDIMSAEEFAKLADTLTSSKKNSELEEIFLKLYEKSKSTIDGVRVFKLLADEYATLNPESNKYTVYATKLLHEASNHHLNAMSKTAEALTLSGEKPEVLYAEIFYRDAERLRLIIQNNDYFSLKRELELLNFNNLPPVKKDEKTRLLEEAAEIRSSMKNEIKAIRDEYFFYEKDELSSLFKELNHKLSLLAKFLIEFDRIYMQEKIRRLVLEYSDIERFAYSSLYCENGEISEFARSLREEYSSVYIDEYQDVNALQAKIFDAVSNARNRFMVGDIKQSIYGFRSADPDIFASMKKAFPKLLEAENASSASIFMSKNFRSDEGIINFVNQVFDKAFGLTADSIGYLYDDRLQFGKTYDEKAPELKKPSFILISGSEEYEEESDSEKKRARESQVVAKKIAEILKNGKLNSGTTPRPSDIAIILRGNRQRMNDYSEALTKLNIPSEKADDKSFFLNSEVLLALCLLNSIDNPQKDIYLAGLLASPLYSFTADELFCIRKGSQGSLYQSLVAYTEKNPEFEKGREFLKKLDFYRTLAEGSSIDSLILRLYNDTGLLELAKRNATAENLFLLYNYAKTFTASSFKGLYNFIKFINNLIERGTQFDAKRDGDESNAVHIMTVHSSKGLEYPIVFYVDTDTLLQDREKSDKIIFAEDFGISMRLRSPDGLALVENPIHNTLIHFNFKRYFEEELRVIYVALTRAREQLYIVGCVSGNPGEYLEKTELKSRFFDSYSIYKTKSALELMLATNPESLTVISECDNEDEENAYETLKSDTPPPKDDFSLAENELSERFKFHYPDFHLTEIPEKLSISLLSPTVLDGSDEERIELIIERKLSEEKKRGIIPDFISGTHQDESAKCGIATHNYLQFFDIEYLQRNGAEKELIRLFDNGFISEENKARVRLSEIELFEKSKFFEEMKNAKQIYRELRFNTRLPARYFTRDEELKLRLGNEELLVQGVIDCILEDANGDLHLVDYKTDRLTKEELNDKALVAKKLNTSHSLQLNYYALAIEKIFGKKPKSVRVYSLPLGDSVDIERIEF